MNIRIIKISIVISLSILTFPVFAAVTDWNLNTTTDYSISGEAEIEFDGTVGKLKVMDTLKFDATGITDPFLPTNYSIISDPTNLDNGIEGPDVYQSEGPSGVLSSDFLPVDTTESYTLSGNFQTIGATDSLVYLGFNVFDKDKNRINAYEQLRLGDDAIISAFDDTTITTAGIADLSTWYQSTTGHRMSIGFYYDGDTSKLPDYVFFRDKYSTAVGSTVNLTEPLPDSVTAEIIPGTTVVKNHYSGSTYMYTAISNSAIPNTWTSYTGTATGESFNTNGRYTFRPETKYLKVVLLANHTQTSSEVLSWDSIEYATTAAGSYSKYDPYIRPNTSQDFPSSVISFTETTGGNHTGTLSYQISTDDGATWKYWDGASWADAGQPDGTHAQARAELESSSAADVNANLSTLDSDGGDFLWKAFLGSDGIQMTELDNINIVFETQTITPTGLIELASTSDTGNSSTDGLTSDNTPEVTATCLSGSAVNIYIDGVANGDTATCTAGTFTLSLSTLLDGESTITFTQTGTGLGDTESEQSTGLTIDVDTTVPVDPIINTPTNGDPSAGIAEPNTTVTIITTSGSTCTTTANDSGNYSCVLTPTPVDEEDVMVTAMDASGNISNLITEIAGIDISVIPTTVVSSSIAELSGTGEPNAILVVTTESGATCTTTVQPDGIWSCVLSPEPISEESATIAATDISGNTLNTSFNIYKNTRSSSIKYTCNDATATNYNRFGLHKSSLCEYDSKELIQATNNTLSTGSIQCTINYKRLLKFNMIGEDVKQVQTCMNSLGYSTGITDGWYGKNTYAGVTAYQKAMNLKYIDGIVGIETSTKLNTLSKIEG